VASVRFAELIEPPIVGDFTDRREAAFFFHPRLKQALKSWTISLGEGWGEGHSAAFGSALYGRFVSRSWDTRVA
jgi:hypothetical protein